VTKADLLGVLDDFDVAKVVRHVRELGNAAPVVTISARSGEGMNVWLDWLRARSTPPMGIASRAIAAIGRT
jgi:hydrogenase nickel incorporation protein HypB